jgi:hypothetical protein
LYTGFISGGGGSSNTAPTASISAPGAGSSFTAGSSISFAGSGSDLEDGALSGSSLVWTSSLDGQIGTGTGFSTSSLSVGTHLITLTATDSKGLTGSATRSITVTDPAPPAPNQPPVAAFTWSCSGNSHKCTLDASGSSDDAGIVSYTWVLGNGVTKTQSSPLARVSFGASGSFNVTLTVRDAGGLTASVSHLVVVP